MFALCLQLKSFYCVLTAFLNIKFIYKHNKNNLKGTGYINEFCL